MPETATWSSRGTSGGAARNNIGTVAHASASATTPASAATTAASASCMRIELAARGAERAPHREIALAPLDADHEQVRHVGAGDQEDDAPPPRAAPTAAPPTGPSIASSSGRTIGRCCSIRRA